MSAGRSKPSRAEDRYEDIGRIAVGGMGEVRRVWDVRLNRSVAMKILRPELAERDDLVQRFIEEAQATAQLEHPGIVPIYDTGTWADGRPYFTMKEIRGRTLLDVIEDLHASAGPRGWGVSPAGWTFQRVIQVFRDVCEAVAYAHSRGVLHRDLKPTNVMVGAFGEVVVMDWGLAKVSSIDGFGDSVGVRSGAHQVMTNRSHRPAYVTRSGSVAGTPNYMPPEQARGDAAKIGPWSDVYALGAILYEILTDKPPYPGDVLEDVVELVLAGPPPPIRMPWQHNDEAIPEEGLRAICQRAMARDLAERYMDATTLGEAVREWLDGIQVREQAIALVRQADAVEPELFRLRKEAATLRARGQQQLAELPSHAAAEAKRAAWALEDRAAALDDEAMRTEARYVHLLRAALTNHPGLPEALERLRGLQESGAARRGERRRGAGWLTLETDVPCAVAVHRFVARDRRLQPEACEAPAATTPIRDAEWPAGSYQIDLSAAGRAALRVLVMVEAGRHESPDPPGPRPMVPYTLPAVGEDPHGTVRIPQGWSWRGGDPEAADSLPRERVWTDAFLIQVHPVTVAEWRTYLDATGGADRPDGWLSSHPPPDWADDQPVRSIPLDAAWRYAAWKSTQDKRLWRLPTEREWERAARGVDERTYPWGNYLDPSFCRIASSEPGLPQVASIYAYPRDVSPWGVCGMGGNVSDWVLADDTSTDVVPPVDRRFLRGGNYLGVGQLARCALRYRAPTRVHPAVGFRLVCPLGR